MPPATIEIPTEYLRDTERPRCAFLAGYARSGAALIRTIMASCFGRQTTSIYLENYIGTDYIRLLKHVELAESEAILPELAAAGGLVIKTHDVPPPAWPRVPAIVIVRDGRRVFRSLLAFYRECNGIDQTMLGLIRGEHTWGDWSDWIRTWAFLCSRRALWLRYEDVMADRRTAVNRLAAYFGIDPISYEIPAFATFQAAKPNIFRVAATSGNGGMTEAEEAEFWQRHGGTMAMLGYYR